MSWKDWLWVNKEGIIIGAIAGAVFYWIQQPIGALNLASVTPTFLDTMLSSTPVQKVAEYKVMLAYVLLGALVGAIIDALYKPNR